MPPISPNLNLDTTTTTVTPQSNTTPVSVAGSNFGSNNFGTLAGAGSATGTSSILLIGAVALGVLFLSRHVL